MTTENGFQLSRIQAEGWKAARSLSASDLAELDDRKIDALNPYSKNSERLRWRAGFDNALVSV